MTQREEVDDWRLPSTQLSERIRDIAEEAVQFVTGSFHIFVFRYPVHFVEHRKNICNRALRSNLAPFQSRRTEAFRQGDEADPSIPTHITA